jgi:hypothetical protein
MRAGVGALSDAVALSRATVTKIKQNFFFAFFYNVVAIPLAAAGLLQPTTSSPSHWPPRVCCSPGWPQPPWGYRTFVSSATRCYCTDGSDKRRACSARA